MCELTVFTPTYNRGYILNQLYQSLLKQTYTNFEWLIIDDGSTDQTESIVLKWKKEQNPFEIRYYKKENGGKCSAINYALDRAQGRLFFTVDSDDYLTNDALSKIIGWEKQLPRDGSYCGVSGNLGTSPNQTPNSLFEEGMYDGTLLDRYHVVDGERALAFYTEVHRKYKYPLFEHEKFMTEAVAWNRMAHDGYKMRFYNDIIWIYEYKEDGLTRAGSRLFLENPHGYGLWLREKALFEHEGLVNRMKLFYTFTCDLSDRITTKEIAKCIDAPYSLIFFIYHIHKIVHKFRK